MAALDTVIDRCCAYCETLVSGTGSLPGLHILHPATLNQGLIRFQREDQTVEEGDAFTDDIIRKINAFGRGVLLRHDLARSARNAGERRELASKLTRC
jgi:hypothetical protein